MPIPLRCIGSMATSGLMREMLARYSHKSGLPVLLESVGGVDAARRVAAGELFDLVVLASDAVSRLASAGVVDASRVVALVRSAVGVAVPADAPRIDISTEQAMQRAVGEAGRIAISTGPSGVALLELSHAGTLRRKYGIAWCKHLPVSRWVRWSRGGRPRLASSK